MRSFVPQAVWVTDPQRYPSLVEAEIKFSLKKIYEEQGKKKWIPFVSSAIQCILLLSESSLPRHFDRKYWIVKETKNMYRVVSLFPLVEDYFWKDMMKYISTHERDLLNVCADESTTQDVRS